MQPRYIRSSPVSRSASAPTRENERATRKRAEKPADKPIQKPAETVAEKAPERPIERRAEKPAERPVEFRLNLPGAKSACVAGSFNGWDVNQTPLAKDPNGGWKTSVFLRPGRYEYRFVIDGAQWFSDPGAKESVPNGFGSTNSVVVV